MSKGADARQADFAGFDDSLVLGHAALSTDVDVVDHDDRIFDDDAGEHDHANEHDDTHGIAACHQGEDDPDESDPEK